MIKNLTVGLPEYGKIKAGTLGEEAVSSQGKKFRLPKKLNHFVITTTERDEEGNLVLDTDLMEILKKSGNAIVDSDGNLTGIPIRLLYNNIDTDFFTRYAAYVGGRCVCAGDGIKATTRDGRVKDCPCEQLEPTYQGKDKCKATGRLICVIEGSPVVGACHILRTTSINTVKSILGSLAFIQTAASGMLAFLPLHLILKPKTVTIPTTGQLTTVYVSSIVYRGSIESLRRDALGMAKDKATYLLEMDSVEASAREALEKLEESEQEQLEINQEFYPDAIDVTPAEQKKAPELRDYILSVDKKPVLVDDPSVAAKWKEENDWKVGVDKIYDHINGDVTISTVFLGTDDNDPPLLFETLVTGGKHDQLQKRYATWDEAEKGHLKIVEKIKEELKSESKPKRQTEESEGKLEAKPAPKPKPSAKPKPKPPAEPPAEQKEVEPEPSTEPEPPMITKDQKREIVALKNKFKITDPALWQKLLEPFGVKTANFLTEQQAKEFIKMLKDDEPPF